MIAIPFCCVRGDGSNARLLPHCNILIIKAFHGVEQPRGAVFLVPKTRGAVRCRYILGESYAAARCGFHFYISYGALRCAAACFLYGSLEQILFFKSHTVRCGTVRGGAVKCGYPFNNCFFQCVPACAV